MSTQPAVPFKYEIECQAEYTAAVSGRIVGHGWSRAKGIGQADDLQMSSIVLDLSDATLSTAPAWASVALEKYWLRRLTTAVQFINFSPLAEGVASHHHAGPVSWSSSFLLATGRKKLNQSETGVSLASIRIQALTSKPGRR